MIQIGRGFALVWEYNISFPFINIRCIAVQIGLTYFAILIQIPPSSLYS
jgi:hypothetical protein